MEAGAAFGAGCQHSGILQTARLEAQPFATLGPAGEFEPGCIGVADFGFLVDEDTRQSIDCITQQLYH